MAVRLLLACAVAGAVAFFTLAVWLIAPTNHYAETTDPNRSEGPILMELPQPATDGEFPLAQAIERRRSVRSFKPAPLSREQVGMLLWSAQGVTCPVESLRAAPSAGATYPLELFVVEERGVHRYVGDRHRLKTVSTEDRRAGLAQAALGQAPIAEAPVNLVIAADYSRTKARYGERGRRYVHMETGHAAQNIHLQAVALGLASVPIGAFEDDAVSALLELPEALAPLYIIPVGYRPDPQ